MKTSKSFSTKLFEAMKNDNKSNRDPNLISEAIQCDFYREANQLIIKGFPSTNPVSQIVLDKIYAAIDTNQEDFFSLILTLILQSSRDDDDIFEFNSYFLKEIPPQNMNFALIMSVFKGRYYKPLDINSQISHYIQNLSKIDFKTEFLSVEVLQVQFFDLLNEKSSKLHLKQATPSKEFIFNEDRNKMCDNAKRIIEICINFCKSKNDNQFYEDLCQILDGLSNELSKVIEKGKNHALSLLVRESSIFFVSGIQKAAKKISELYIKDAIDYNADNISTILQNIQDHVIQKSSVNYQESLILAELIAILFKKQDKPRKFEKYNKILMKFNKSILKFENNFKENREYISKYNNCINYPKKRNDYLLDIKTETSKSLIILGKALQYVKYIAESSFIDAIMHLEHCMVLDGMIDPKIASNYEQEANIRFSHHSEISKKITKFLNEMKPFSLINLPLKDFIFDNDFPKYKFDPEFNLDNATADDIHQIFVQKINLKLVLPYSVMAMKIPKCLHCKTIPVQRICGNCGKFVTCQKCASKGCPICQNPLPVLS